MKVCGIVAEYNPFHNGHLYHLKKSKIITNSDAVIAVISGNFVQRGVPSILDKWNKTEIALNAGIDLVIELPILYSLSSAEFFAFGAISLLNNLGIVDNICFGCEDDQINIIKKISQILLTEPSQYKNLLKLNLDKGLNFPNARKNALKEYLNKKNSSISSEIDQILKNSNNILGIEYCKSILKLKSSIHPYCIERMGSPYNDLDLKDNFSSASSIRHYMKSNLNYNELNKFIPNESYIILKKLIDSHYNFAFEDNMFPYIKYKTMLCGNKLYNLPDANEGIDNKILKEIYFSNTLDNLISRVKSKRYTYTRISRILAQFFIGFEQYDISQLRKEQCPYARILGFNKTGRELLKSIKINSNIPVYTKLPRIKNDVLKLDLQSTKAYSLLNKNINPFSDLLNKVIIKN